MQLILAVVLFASAATFNGNAHVAKSEVDDEGKMPIYGECNHVTGECICIDGYYGEKCQNRDCKWSSWTTWSSCSKQCGYGGTESRTRQQIQGPVGQGAPCSGGPNEQRGCFKGCCSGQFHCSNRARCIAATARCNYNNDCGDNQDEVPCNEQCAMKYTGWNSHGNGDSVYLDRHNVDCGGAVLKMFHLQRNGNNIRFQYTCCTLNQPTLCSVSRKQTGFSYDGNGNAVYLDRQTVSCGNQAFMTGFWLGRNSAHDHIRYNFGCCQIADAHLRHRMRCSSAFTPFTYNGRGKSYYLDRQTVTCPGRSFLTHYKLDRRGNEWRYNYTCCQVVS